MCLLLLLCPVAITRFTFANVLINNTRLTPQPHLVKVRKMTNQKNTDNKTASEPAKRGPRPRRKYVKGNDGVEYLLTKPDLDRFLDSCILWHCQGGKASGKPFPMPVDFNGEAPDSMQAFHITEKETPLDLLKLKSIFASGKEDEATAAQPVTSTNKPNK